MAQLAVINAFQEFMDTAHSCVDIHTEADYEGALETLEYILESATDTKDDPLNPLIELISHAIEQYEAEDDELVAFVEEAESVPTDVALLRALMQQHGLTGSDLPEIGGKSMVSRVLNGNRDMSRQSIECLANRFGIRPAMFFGG